MAERYEAGGRGATGSALIDERSWLAALTLSRAFITLIFMTYAASLPTLSREWAMTATQAGLVQTCFTAGFGVSLFLTSWLADHVGARRMFVWSCWSGALAMPSSCQQGLRTRGTGAPTRDAPHSARRTGTSLAVVQPEPRRRPVSSRQRSRT